MHAPLAQISLKNVWLEALPESVPGVITPLGFKSIIQSTVDFLMAQKLSASLWLKLPKGRIWHADVDRYAPQAKHLYCFERVPDVDHSTLPWFSLPLPSQTILRGEYLFLVTAPDFFYAFLAVQQPIKPPTSASPEAQSSRRLRLKLYSSCSPQLLTGLKPALQTLVKQAAQPKRESSTPMPRSWAKHLLIHWERVFPALPQAIPSPYLEAFLNWQLQTQAQVLGRSQGSPTLVKPPENQPESLPQPADPAPLTEPFTLADNFIDVAGQEIRTPLTTIKTALTLLNAPKLRVSLRQQYLDMISRESDRQRTLIQGVFELLRLQNQTLPTPLIPLKLNHLLPGIVSTYQPLAQERQIRLDYAIPETLPAVTGTEPWLKQAVIHLIENGIQFTPAGGEVWVSAHQQSDQAVAIVVKDTGCGIRKNDLPRIFDAFYRSSGLGREPGSGLGLTLAQAFLAKCGGTITVESLPGKGTVFTVLLPILKTAN